MRLPGARMALSPSIQVSEFDGYGPITIGLSAATDTIFCEN